MASFSSAYYTGAPLIRPTTYTETRAIPRPRYQQRNKLFHTALCYSGEQCTDANCQYAHTANELKPRRRNPRYKTEPCKTVLDFKICQFGEKCHFKHPWDKWPQLDEEWMKWAGQAEQRYGSVQAAFRVVNRAECLAQRRRQLDATVGKTVDFFSQNRDDGFDQGFLGNGAEVDGFFSGGSSNFLTTCQMLAQVAEMEHKCIRSGVPFVLGVESSVQGTFHAGRERADSGYSICSDLSSNGGLGTFGTVFNEAGSFEGLGYVGGGGWSYLRENFGGRQ
ncbi:uncharacterized protein LOC129592297 isoform X2 [Paramacrobiotus metropolitanus]|uniref:uncharacterized protein LOC129592297 isoform X2 n=1 Tax=Paramacrobiotus metropolitanus TaxID=2943436 RepID=UPI002445A43A|nr:uncharacterized protein LOC129592297 isoform X2 [Paramacrobiotus metropolitanus]